MTRRPTIAMRAWPVVALVLFWLELSAEPAVQSFVDLGVAATWALIAAGSVGVYGAMSLLVVALRDPSYRRWRIYGAAAIGALFAAGLTVSPLYSLSAAALSSLFWMAALRVVPRLTLGVWVLLFGGMSIAYFAAVLLLIGLIVLPSPVSAYVRELMPRRVGSAP